MKRSAAKNSDRLLSGTAALLMPVRHLSFNKVSHHLLLRKSSDFARIYCAAPGRIVIFVTIMR